MAWINPLSIISVFPKTANPIQSINIPTAQDEITENIFFDHEE
jgi:hypothetical protein